MWRSYGSCAVPMQLPCSLRKFRVEIARRMCELHTDAERRWYGDFSRAIRLSQEPTITIRCLWPKGPAKILRFLQDQLAAFARYQHDAPTTYIRVTGLHCFQIRHKSLLNKLVVYGRRRLIASQMRTRYK